MNIQKLNRSSMAFVWFILAMFVPIPALLAAQYDVENEAELAAAITAVNASEEPDTINFEGDIVLTSELPMISKTLGLLTIEGNNHILARHESAATQFRILNIYEYRVAIQNLTITNGSAVQGAGIHVIDGDLTLTNCRITGNTASDSGGGIRVSSISTLTMVDSSIDGNTAGNSGGGLWANAHVTLRNSTISGNTAENNGGGIWNYFGDGMLPGDESIIEDSTISGNTSNSGAGGGIAAFTNAHSRLLVSRSTLSGNAASSGGGINTAGGVVELTNCTVSDNQASVEGGGFHIASGANFVKFCTITGNRAAQYGGVNQASGTFRIFGSIVAGNSSDSDAHEMRASTSLGSLESEGYNIFGHSGRTTDASFSGFSFVASDLVATSDGTQPTNLAAILDLNLADNGGATMTHALPVDSPAIGFVPNTEEFPSTDQRGVVRPQGSAVDAGSFEWQAPVVTEPGDESGASFEEYWHTVTSNTITLRNWNLDPNSILGDSPAHSFASGSLPRGLSLNGPSLTGRFADLGSYAFIIVSRSGIHEVRNHFQVRVIPPAVCPLISGIWVNDQYHSMNIMEARGHGVAAVTELFSLTVAAGEPLSMVFDWDYIKDDSSFKIIRGVVPQGMALKKQHVNGFPSAAITGTPTEAGEFIFVVSVLDWRGRGYQWIRLVVE